MEIRAAEKGLDMSTTGLVVYIGILALAIYDLTVVVFKGTASSVSQFLIRTAFRSPLITFAFGATCGHLFLYMWDSDCSPDWTERLIIGTCGAVIGAVLTYGVCSYARGKD